MLLTKKTIVRAVLVVGFFAIMGTVYGDIDVSKFKSPKDYKGTVKTLCTTNVKMGIDQTFKGEVIYVVHPGTLFNGPVVNKKGEVIKPGTVLAEMEGATLRANLAQAQATLNMSEADFEAKQGLFDKYKVIAQRSGGSAISKQDILNAKADYLQAVAQIKADEAAVLIAKQLLDTITYNARFDGVVTKVLFPGGYTTAADRDVLEVKQLIPIGVEIEMTREESFKYGENTPIAIYPLGYDRAIGPYRGLTTITDKGVMFLVANYRKMDEVEKIDGKDVPVIHNISPIIPFELDEQNTSNMFYLGVNIECVQKDDKGEFLMVVDGQLMTRAINPVFKLKKVYVKTADEINPVEASVRYIKLQDSGGLKMSAIVLTTNESKGLKDGETVYYQNSRYLFMPGDPVRVVLDTGVTNKARDL